MSPDAHRGRNIQRTNPCKPQQQHRHLKHPRLPADPVGHVDLRTEPLALLALSLVQ